MRSVALPVAPALPIVRQRRPWTRVQVDADAGGPQRPEHAAGEDGAAAWPQRGLAVTFAAAIRRTAGCVSAAQAK